MVRHEGKLKSTILLKIITGNSNTEGGQNFQSLCNALHKSQCFTFLKLTRSWFDPWRDAALYNTKQIWESQRSREKN